MRQKTYKRVAFWAMVVTLLFSIGSLLLLWADERPVRNVEEPQRLVLEGKYTSSELEGASPIPADGQLMLPERRQQVVLTGRLTQNVPAGELISLRLDNLYIRILCNDELVFTHGAPYSVLPYVSSSGSGWQYFSSPGLTTGDEIRIELQNLYTNHVAATYQDFLQKLYVGNPVVPLAQELQGFSLQGLMALFILLLGFLELLYACALLRSKMDANRYFALAGLSVFSGIWFLVNYNVMELFLPYPIINNAIHCLSLTLGLCYILLYVSTVLRGKGKACLLAGAFLAMVLTVVSVLAQHFGICDYYDFIPLLYLLIALSGITILVLLCLEFRARNTMLERQSLLPLFLLLLGAMADVLLSLLGVLPFLLFEITLFVFNLWQIYLAWVSISHLARETEQVRVLREEHDRQQRMLAYQALISQSTKGLYESIYELDITHNCAASDATRSYFETLGVPGDSPYDEALHHIANRQIQAPYRQGYLDTFSSRSVLEQFAQGIDSLQYDFRFTKDGDHYYWMRIDARIFFWQDDRSVRMIAYRQNVDDEKQRELLLRNRVEVDPLTGLLNRDGVEHHVEAWLCDNQPALHLCCLIMDVDNFKGINDQFGHLAGDHALTEFARLLKQSFRPTDIVGRLGGDEFVVFAPAPALHPVAERASGFLSALATSNIQFEGLKLPMSASIGIAALPRAEASYEILYKQADAALYRSKNNGKNCYSIYGQ